MSNNVTSIPAARSEAAVAHFEREFTFQTDCWDVHSAMTSQSPGFILLDVRSQALYERGHVAGAVHLPHGKIIESKINQWPRETLFVTYCAGPHCNGAARGALALSKLGRPAKIMAGGVTGWIDEGFPLVTDTNTKL